MAAYLGGALFFEHQDWLGTERMLTDGAGHAAGSYLSLPFGDGFTDQGTDLDPYHFAGMDHDYESGLDHAQYREYSSAAGRWLSPDPYSGSYDWSNPQSLNRYAYVGNNPLSLSDPSGLFILPPLPPTTAIGCTVGPVGCGVAVVIGVAAVGLGDILQNIFSEPSFHGSLKPRPNAQPWDEYNIHYGSNLAGALGLPDQSCEFGACGISSVEDFQAQAVPLVEEGAGLIKECLNSLPCRVAISTTVGTITRMGQHGRGNKADTGILDRARNLADQLKLDLCSALDLLYKDARSSKDTRAAQAVKATQKALGCRASREE